MKCDIVIVSVLDVQRISEHFFLCMIKTNFKTIFEKDRNILPKNESYNKNFFQMC